VNDPADHPELERVLDEARRRGYFGPPPIAEQLAHARAFVGLMAAAGIAPSSFLDLGSGGGLPGLAIAAAWPNASGVLLDASARRCAFLQEATRALGWEERIQVVEGRAEALARHADLRAGFALVVSRSFAGPPVTAEIGGAFLAPGGALVVSEPESDEGRWPAAGLARLGLVLAESLRADGAGIAVLRRTEAVEETWPRAVGIPAKRPLW
jgi:16S rRNA (guanine527-N7)-methyltransferase